MKFHVSATRCYSFFVEAASEEDAYAKADERIDGLGGDDGGEWHLLAEVAK